MTLERCSPPRTAAPLILAALVATGAPGMLAEEPEQTPRSAFSETLETSIAELDVTVTNADGIPVGGLDLEDFTLEVDGQPVPLLSVHAGAVVRSGPMEAIDPAPLTLLVDWSSLGPVGRRQLKELIEDIERLPDEVLVASWDGVDLQLRRVVGDRAELVVVLDLLAAQAPPNPRSGGRDLARLVERVERALKLDEILPNPEGSPGEDAEVLHEIRSWANQRAVASHNLLATAARVVGALAGVPGRKALVLVTADLPERPADDLYRAWAEVASTKPGQARPSGAQLSHLDFAPEFDKLTELANRSRVTLFPAFLREQGSVIAASRTAGANLQQSLERIQISSAAEGVRHLAEGTGGVSSTTVGGMRDLLRGALGGTAGDYTLVFTPPATTEGRREVVVRAADDTLTVRHRPALPPRADGQILAERLQATLLLDMGRNELQSVVEVLGADPAENGETAVTLAVSIPLRRILLAPGAEAHQGRIRLLAGASRGQEIVEVAGFLAPIRVANHELLTALGQDAVLRVQLKLPTGRHRLGVVLLDELSGALGSAILDYDVPATATTGVQG